MSRAPSLELRGISWKLGVSVVQCQGIRPYAQRCQDRAVAWVGADGPPLCAEHAGEVLALAIHSAISHARRATARAERV